MLVEFLNNDLVKSNGHPYREAPEMYTQVKVTLTATEIQAAIGEYVLKHINNNLVREGSVKDFKLVKCSVVLGGVGGGATYDTMQFPKILVIEGELKG
jgi:hypothetical protein